MSNDHAFMRNDLLISKDNSRHRVLFIDVDRAWLMALDSPAAMPFDIPNQRWPSPSHLNQRRDS